MQNRDDFLKRLREDPRYKEAIAKARTPAEKQKIVNLVEGFVGSFGEILGPLIERSKIDPEFAQQLGQALSGRQDVVTTEPVSSGSTG